MIPVARPSLGEEEAASAREVILSGWVTQGPKVKEFEDNFSSFVGSQFACAVSSCTTALHLALLVAGVKPGDVVITVSHSFIATANAVRYCYAEPVFVDIDPKTYNMEPGELEKCLTDKCDSRDGELYYRDVSKLAVNQSPLQYLKDDYKIGRIAAILPVHQMGMPCAIHAILSIANKFCLPVIEDAACAIGSEVRIDDSWEKIGRPHGDLACFSFHPRKVITTGDGGMITTNNVNYDRQLRLLRQHGMSVPDTLRHKAKNIIFEEYPILGHNYRMTDIQAAIGIEQLKKLPDITKNFRNINRIYHDFLGDVPWIVLPEEPAYAKTNWQSYPIRIRKEAPLTRDEFMQYLLDNGVSTRPGIMNAHKEKVYVNPIFNLSESEKARNEVVLIPIYDGLEENEVKKISDLIHGIA